jgi:hypothetical protein
MDWQISFLIWLVLTLDGLLVNFSAFANLVFAGTVAGAAVVALILNRGMLAETSALRKAETDPFVAVYLEQGRAGVFFFDLVIRNVARGPAFDVSFVVAPDVELEEEDDGKLSDIALIRNGIEFMAPGQEIRFHFGSYVSLTKTPITVKVDYFDAPRKSKGMKFDGTFVLDVGKYEGMSQLDELNMQDLVRTLQKLQTDIHAIKTGQAELKVTGQRRYFFSRYASRKWHKLFGRQDSSNPQLTSSDLWHAFRNRHRRR